MNKTDEPIVEEEFVPEDGEGNELSKVARLKEKLAVAEEKAKEYLDKWQRAQADFVNMRKQDEEAKVEFMKYAGLGVISQLIPVLDSFSLAISHVNKDAEVIYNQLSNILKSMGLEELNPDGEVFDPSKHEGVGLVKTENPAEDHKVLEVLQKGYMIGGKTIRPAKVKVGEFINQ